jgi:hypothetical protein
LAILHLVHLDSLLQLSTHHLKRYPPKKNGQASLIKKIKKKAGYFLSKKKKKGGQATNILKSKN